MRKDEYAYLYQSSRTDSVGLASVKEFTKRGKKNKNKKMQG